MREGWGQSNVAGVIGFAGEIIWGVLPPESLLVLLIPFRGGAVRVVRKSSTVTGLDSSMPGCSRLFSFRTRCSTNVSQKLSWRFSIGTFSSIIGGFIFRIAFDYVAMKQSLGKCSIDAAFFWEVVFLIYLVTVNGQSRRCLSFSHLERSRRSISRNFCLA